jgi:C4-dicarboxylate-specific signal transduction histidine kinase
MISWLLFERRRRIFVVTGRAKVETGQYRERLAHLVRVHTVGEMSMAITHEISQPLAAIKNYAFAARRRLAGGGAQEAAKAEELLDKIEVQASRAGDVLQSLRAMVKKHDSEAAIVQAGDLVTDALSLVEGGPEHEHPGWNRSHAVFHLFVDRDSDPAGGAELARNAIEAAEAAGMSGSVSMRSNAGL